MKFVGNYDHLNDHSPVEMPLDLDALATIIVKANYGGPRMLAALVRAMEQREEDRGPVQPKLVEGLKDLLQELGHC